jgi:hypothetical protein
MISAAPEFNQFFSLIAISNVAMGRDSMKDFTYVQFTFAPLRSSSALRGRGQFRFRDGRWYFTDFWYGDPPNVRSFTIQRPGQH